MTVKVNTSRAPFTAIAAILSFTPDEIVCVPAFNDPSDLSLLEASAQAAAHHARYITGWERHAFLLGMRNGAFTQEDCPDGVSAARTANGGSVRSYLTDCSIGGRRFKATMLIATEEYRCDEERIRLSAYYKGIWECCTKG